MIDTTKQGWSSLVLRPILLFVAGFAINAVLHELAHALAAHWFYLPSTLHHFYVAVDLKGQPPLTHVAVRIAGPLFSLIFGVICWYAHRTVRETWAALPLLYLAVFGVAMFLGGMMSMSYAGDFRDAANALELAHWIRSAVSVTGAVLLIAFSYDVGRELRESVPPSVGGFIAMLAVVVVPTIVGTALLIAAYQPMGQGDMLVRLTESAFWLFAAIGTAVGSVRPPRMRDLRVRLGDWALALAAVAAVRVLAFGIPVSPAVAPPEATPPPPPAAAVPQPPAIVPAGPARRPRPR